MTRVLNVWWDERLVGRLSQNRHGELGFVYSADWLGRDDGALPLSVSLPKRAAPFSRRECGPFFGGLLPAPGQATTHILKPPIARFPDTVENEAFVMRLARSIGLHAAPVEPRTVRHEKFLLIERYDRALAANGTVRRIHQEDFCQALGIWPHRKYASEGGPTLRDCFALLRRAAARPAVEILKLLDAVIFNLIAGNADAHGKNFSLLYSDAGTCLAPLYDLLATVAYPALSPRLAMKIGKRATLEEMDSRGWESFAAQAGLGRPLVRRRVAEISAAVESGAREVAGALEGEGLDGGALSRLAETVASRASRCALGIPVRQGRAGDR